MARNVQSKYEAPAAPVPGSHEDIEVLLEVLHGFFGEKLKAAQLYRKTGRVAQGTFGTQSVCDIDGTTDGDTWEALG
jgi:hypothetical protein